MGAAAVVAGSIGAHVLKDILLAADLKSGEPQRVDPASKRLEQFETGVRYHMYHALALLAVAILARGGPNTCLQTAGWLFLAGMLLFSGTLYVMAFAAPPWGMIVMLGGLCYIAGWLALAVAALVLKIET
jgi:uncharacterized membrane protein YgdD (TMEM256/DUF423 family)